MHFLRLRTAAQSPLMIRASLPPGYPGPPFNDLCPRTAGSAGTRQGKMWVLGSPLVVGSPARLALCSLSGASIFFDHVAFACPLAPLAAALPAGGLSLLSHSVGGQAPVLLALGLPCPS
eukprot:15078038-Heterocapsa_arctica.AAC.1